MGSEDAGSPCNPFDSQSSAHWITASNQSINRGIPKTQAPPRLQTSPEQWNIKESIPSRVNRFPAASATGGILVHPGEY